MPQPRPLRLAETAAEPYQRNVGDPQITFEALSLPQKAGLLTRWLTSSELRGASRRITTAVVTGIDHSDTRPSLRATDSPAFIEDVLAIASWQLVRGEEIGWQSDFATFQHNPQPRRLSIERAMDCLCAAAKQSAGISTEVPSTFDEFLADHMRQSDSDHTSDRIRKDLKTFFAEKSGFEFIPFND